MEDAARTSLPKGQPAATSIATASDPGANNGAFFPGGVAFYSGNASGVHPYSIFAGQVGRFAIRFVAGALAERAPLRISRRSRQLCRLYLGLLATSCLL